MLPETINKYRIILGSGSPRRHFLMKEAGIDYEVIVPNIDETYPEHLKAEKIPIYLSQKKAEALKHHLDYKTIIITADTIVWINKSTINKPNSYDEAFQMLETLSGNCHEVFTGVTILSPQKTYSFFVKSKVYFKKLSKQEIKYYIDNFKPYDKAGAYGIQEWIGYIGIKKLEGSFYNVMGLPITKLYAHLKKFIK